MFGGKDSVFQTPAPWEGTKWALLAKKGAISEMHIDANGYGTFISIIAGEKWWYLGWTDPRGSYLFSCPKEEEDFCDRVSTCACEFHKAGKEAL